VTHAARRLILPGFMTAIMLLVLIGLGTWQVERLYWKEALLAEIDLMTEWYLPYALGRAATPDEIAEHRALWRKTLESVSDVTARIHEAARYTGLERLGVSTQCGFSSTLPGANLTTEDVQEQKLELVAEVANTVW